MLLFPFAPSPRFSLTLSHPRLPERPNHVSHHPNLPSRVRLPTSSGPPYFPPFFPSFLFSPSPLPLFFQIHLSPPQTTTSRVTKSCFSLRKHLWTDVPPSPHEPNPRASSGAEAGGGDGREARVEVDQGCVEGGEVRAYERGEWPRGQRAERKGKGGERDAFELTLSSFRSLAGRRMRTSPPPHLLFFSGSSPSDSRPPLPFLPFLPFHPHRKEPLSASIPRPPPPPSSLRRSRGSPLRSRRCRHPRRTRPPEGAEEGGHSRSLRATWRSWRRSRMGG